jgi:fibronectin-binding autotransporter adhesin
VPSGATTGRLTVTVNGQTGTSVADFTVAGLGILSGVEDPINSAEALIIYPNPTDGMATVRFPKSINTKYGFVLSDMNGAGVLSGNGNASEFDISLKNVPSGVYFVTLEYDGKTIVKQLIKY